MSDFITGDTLSKRINDTKERSGRGAEIQFNYFRFDKQNFDPLNQEMARQS